MSVKKLNVVSNRKAIYRVIIWIWHTLLVGLFLVHEQGNTTTSTTVSFNHMRSCSLPCEAENGGARR